MNCSVEDCGKKHYGHGYCRIHYRRMKNNGSIHLTRRENGTGTFDQGYCRHQINGQRISEHILVAERILGHKLPEGTVVHHIDGNRSNNIPSNLVICEDQAYHKLLHARQRAYDATGDATKRKCYLCKEWDSIENLFVSRKSIYHRACKQAYNRKSCNDLD